MDFPIYPDDLVPKVLQGTDIQRNGWFPWVYGICKDGDGEKLLLVMSINVGFGGPRARVYVKGTYLDVKPDTSKRTYSNGILTIGDLPKITIDYHHPHHVRVDFDATTYMEFDVTYRGIPLWYGKTTDPSDCERISRNMKCGGYDAPCVIVGKVVHEATTVTFAGYGDWEHTWLFGPMEWATIRTKWLIFNDANYCGVLVKSWDEITGEVVLNFGRLTVVNTNTSLVFDDYALSDDGKQPTDQIAFSGTARSINGTVQIPVNMTTQSFAHIYNGAWTQFALVGTINGQPFNGTCWSEYHNNRLEPPPNGVPIWLLVAVGVAGIAGIGYYYYLMKR